MEKSSHHFQLRMPSSDFVVRHHLRLVFQGPADSGKNCQSEDGAIDQDLRPDWQDTPL